MKKKNCVLLYGNDPVSINDRKDAIVKAYFKGKAPDPVIFDGEGSYGEFINQMRGSSLFSPLSAIIIRNPFFFHKGNSSGKSGKEFQNFKNVLEGLGPETLVVFLYDEQEGKPDLRRKIWKEMLSLCTSEECSLVNPENAGSIFVNMLTEKGLHVEQDAREYLSEVLAGWKQISRPFLQTECDKIALLCGSSENVDLKLLETALPDYMDQGIFNFTSALLQKKAAVVLRSVDRVFTDFSTNIQNLGFIASRFRKIKMLKEMQRRGTPMAAILKRLGLRNSWALKYLQKDAREISEEDAEFFLTGLFQYEYQMRSGSQNGIDPNFYLKDFLLRFCMRKGKT